VRRVLYYCRLGKGATELRRTSLDDPGEGDLLFRDESESASLMSPKLVKGGALLTVSKLSASEITLHAFDLGGEPPLEPLITHRAARSKRHMLVSPDGRWLLVSDRDANPTVRRIHDDWSLGVPVDVPTGGLRLPGSWWSRDALGDGYRIHSMPSDSRGVYVIEMREGDAGLEFSEPAHLLGLSEGMFLDAAHFEGGRDLGIVMDPDEFARDTVCVMIGGLGALLED